MAISRLVYGSTSLVALMLVSSPASAQSSAPPAPAAGDDSGLQEIIVTAEKRPSAAQRTPIAMTVATAKQLTATGVTSLNQMINLAPTLNIAQTNVSTVITIRGVSSRDATETGDPAVSISIDNFYLQNALGLNAALFDVERVEVLNGPQGTLYGRNATAGAVNITTAKPLDHFAMTGAVEGGNYGTLNTEGMINVPVTSTLAIRASGAIRTHEGYRNLSPAPDGDSQDSKAARIHVQWKPDSRFTALLTGEYVKETGNPGVIRNIPFTQVNADGTIRFGDDRNFPHNTPGFLDLAVKSVRGMLSYDLGPATVSYYGGYRTLDYDRDNDIDGTATQGWGFLQHEKIDTQNHEIRLTSNGTGPLSFQAGAYFKETDNLLSFFQLHSDTAPTVNAFSFDYVTKASSKAVFGQVGYALTDTVKVEGGVRYTKDKKSQVGRNEVFGAITDLDNHYSGDKVTWHVGANWQATPANLLYAKVDSGYKAGGYTSTNAFGPETITAYEVGSKNRFLDNTLQVNLSAFYYDYANLQTQQSTDAALIVTLNAGKAEIYGGEFQATWLATTNDRIDANAAYLHARYRDFLIAGDTGNVQYAGNRLPQAPTWALTAGYEHDFHIGDAVLNARVQSRYQSLSYFNYNNSTPLQQKKYTKTDIILTYTPNDSHWSVSLFGRNLEKARILTRVDASAFVNGFQVQYGDPRTYGARVAFNF